MPVVITKPAAQQPQWIDALRDAGWDTISLPLLTLENLPESPQQRNCWLDLDQFQGVIAVSPHAAEILAERLDQWWPQAPVGINWLCPGPGTAAVLSRRHPDIQPVYPGAGHTAEDLLALPQTRSVDGQKWLILAGEGGRPTLQDTLIARGARVSRLALYRRRSVTLEDKALDALAALDRIIQISSLQALESLTSQVSLVTKQKATLLVSSKRLADAAHSMQWKHVIQAGGASLNATLESLAANRTTLS